MEHVLILLIVAFVLYHFTGRCNCFNNGFRVGGAWGDPDDPYLGVVAAHIFGIVRDLSNVNLANSYFTNADLSSAENLTNIECNPRPVHPDGGGIKGMSSAKVKPIYKDGKNYPATFECAPPSKDEVQRGKTLGLWHKIPKCEPFGKDLDFKYDETECNSKYLKNFCTWEPSSQKCYQTNRDVYFQ